MLKPSFPALLNPGIHECSLDDVRKLCVDPFPNSNRRPLIWDRFEPFVSQLTALGLPFEMWIDGSYLSEKPEPEDIDVVLFITPKDLSAMPPQQQQMARNLLGNIPRTKQRYLTDVRTADPTNPDDRMHWRGVYGFDYHDQPKGWVKLRL